MNCGRDVVYDEKQAYGKLLATNKSEICAQRS